MMSQVHNQVKMKIQNRLISIMKYYCRENSNTVKIIGKEDTIINRIQCPNSNRNRTIAAEEINQ